jgi:putative membrane protein
VTLDSRNLRILVLACWAGFLAWLWLTGETLRYLGPRTQWLVPFGAAMLGVAAVAYARSTAPARSRPSLGETVGLTALLLPIVAGMLLVHTQLGALAASKKLTARGIDASALAELASRNAAELSFLEVNVAGHNDRFADENGIQPGRRARLVGFVLHAPEQREGAFELARFYITCCVADALPLGVTVEPADPLPAGLARDDWLSVKGELVRSHGELRLRAARIDKVEAPAHPYLSFGS